MPALPGEAALVVDTHVHLYRCYDIGATLLRARDHLLQLADRLNAAPAVPVICLAERFDHDVFADLKSGRIGPSPGFRIEAAEEAAGLLLQPADGAAPLVILAGRQIVTAEKIEVLGLAMEAVVPDGRPLDETLAGVRTGGGIPVLSWAPGKWFFRRGRLVRAAISQAAPGDLLLGDTSLRPWPWGEPCLMRLGRRRGLGIVAGSDPLPFAADGAWAGRVATVYRPGPFDPKRAVSAAARRLRHETPWCLRAGARLSPIAVLGRLRRNHQSKRRMLHAG